MRKPKKSTIEVQGTDITILSKELGDYISLTDMVRNFEGGSALIEQWLKSKDTVLFLGVWEQIHNPGFNSLEFEGIRNEAGRNSFFLSAKAWIERTGAKGLAASAGRYGGTFAHKDIAFEFGSWLSPEFKLYLIKEFQRLKDDENRRLSLAWNLNRTLSKLNYRIHTDAVIPKGLCPPAQGCEGRTTLGHSGEMVINPTGVVAFVVAIGTQPRWGRIMIGRFSQGSSGLATLGFEPESRWDSTAAKIRSRRSTVPPLHPTSFRILPWKGVLAA